MKKGDLVRVSADHPTLGGQVGTFLRWTRIDLRAQGSNKVAVVTFKKTNLNDEWLEPRWLEPASVIDKLGKLVQD